MLKHIIVVTLNNVSEAEKQELRDYLDKESWGWEEKSIEVDNLGLWGRQVR